jgi:hypothetical protein
VDFVWVGDADDPDDALKIANFDIREDPSAFQDRRPTQGTWSD